MRWSWPTSAAIWRITICSISSLDSVSEILHISPAYLSAQFKKYQKMNFLDCLTELRINAAKQLLTDPLRSAAEVASMVGYEDASYFARAFKKRTGMTPTQYRREAAVKPGGSSVSARRIAALTLAAVLCLLMLAGCVVRPKEQAQTQPELLLRYAENQPADYPTTQAALAFAEMVSQRTDGRVKILVYSDGELGSEPSVVQQMQFGGIDFSRVSLSELANILPGLSILQLPYLYEDAAQMWRVLDGPLATSSCWRWMQWGWWGFPGLMQACAAFIPGRRSPAWRICRGWLCGCSSLA